MAAGPKTLRKSPDPTQNAVGGVWARDYHGYHLKTSFIFSKHVQRLRAPPTLLIQ